MNQRGGPQSSPNLELKPTESQVYSLLLKKMVTPLDCANSTYIAFPLSFRLSHGPPMRPITYKQNPSPSLQPGRRHRRSVSSKALATEAKKSLRKGCGRKKPHEANLEDLGGVLEPGDMEAQGPQGVEPTSKKLRPRRPDHGASWCFSSAPEARSGRCETNRKVLRGLGVGRCLSIVPHIGTIVTTTMGIILVFSKLLAY